MTSAIRSVTSSTFGRVSVGYQSSVSISRLQPISSVGVTLRRSSGSAIALLIWRRPTARNGGSSQRWRVIAAAPSSWNAKIDRAVEPLQDREALEQPLGALR